MKKLHIFIDGTWLFKACKLEGALSSKLESPKAFKLDFSRLCNSLLKYASQNDPDCNALGERYCSTSIFQIPPGSSSWIGKTINQETITKQDLETLEANVNARELFAENAISAGFDTSVIHRPELKDWMLSKLKQGVFQEKQVDTTVVALLVRSAIVNKDDYHAVITGDVDILPAIKVAHPTYSRNVFIVTTHPEQLKNTARQSSFALKDFDWKIEPYYLDEKASQIVAGEYVYTCGHCNRTFIRAKPIPQKAKPCCSICNQKRT